MRMKTKPKKKRSNSVANVRALDPKRKPAIKSKGGKVKLWCEEGEHYWHRPAQRGRKPTNCPKHAPEKPESNGTNGNGMVTLHCEIGDHEWERPSQRGKKPRNCPEHQPEQPTKRERGEEPTRREETLDQIWEKVTQHREFKNCQCGLEKGMSASEVRALYPGCKRRWNCGALQRYYDLLRA